MISKSRGANADRSAEPNAASPGGRWLGIRSVYPSCLELASSRVVYSAIAAVARSKKSGFVPLAGGANKTRFGFASSLVRVVSHARVPVVRESSPESRSDPRKAPLRCLDGGSDFVSHDP